jgi:hypothetical protein
MRIPYFEAAPPYAINAVECPDDEEEAKRSRFKLEWPLSAALRRSSLRTHLVGTVFPVAIHHARPDLWLLETQDRADPRAVIKDPEDLLFALDQEHAKGPATYHFFQLAENDALRYILMAGYPLPDDISLPQPTAPDPPATAPRTAMPGAGSDGPARTGPPVGTTEGTKPAAAGTSGDDGPIPVDTRETNVLIKRELERDPNATSVAISKATGIPNQTVRRSKPWRERPRGQARQEPKITDAMDRARPLTPPLLAVIPSCTMDPAEVVAEQEERDHPEAIEPIEVLRNRFLADATQNMRGRFHSLTPDQQEKELRAWELTGDFLPDEPPSPAPLGRRLAERRSV